MSRFRRLTRLLPGIVLTVCVSSLPVHAADEVSPLSLVGDSVAVCLEVPHFEETWTQFHRSELAARLKRFPPVERLLSGPGIQKWQAVEEYARVVTGKTVSEQLLAAFSESILVAVYLPDDGKPQGVLIGQARNEEAMKQAIHSWNRLDQNHVAQVREHHGQSYVRRGKTATSDEVQFYATFGRIFVLSDQEPRVREVIDYHAAASRSAPDAEATSATVRTLKESAFYQTNRSRLPADAAAFLHINARAWDRVFAEATRNSPDAELARKAFQCVSAAGLSVRLNDEAVADLVLDISTDARTSAWRQFVEAARNSNWAAQVPPEAILTVCGRMDVRPLIQGMLALIPESKTREFARVRKTVNGAFLGRDLLLEILPDLFHDWTASISISDASSSPEVPVEAVAQFSVASSFGRSLDNALQFGMNLVAAYISSHGDENANPAIVNAVATDAGAIRSLAGLGVWSPSYLLRSESLTIATSRSVLERAPTAARSENSRLIAAERRYLASTSQLVWLDAVRLRDLLARHSGWISGQIAPDSSNARERVQTHLSRVHEALKLFDAAFVAARFDEDHVRVVFGATLDRID